MRPCSSTDFCRGKGDVEHFSLIDVKMLDRDECIAVQGLVLRSIGRP